MAYKSLDNILNEDSDTSMEIRPALPETTPEPGEQPQPEPAQAEEVEAGPPPAEDARSKGLEAAAAAERRKRQEVEAQLEALRREVQAKPQEPAAPPPSIWEDEQGTFQHYGQQFTQTAVQQAAYISRLQTSELLMLQSEPEFEAVKQDVYEFVGSNPALNAQVQNSAHPWKTAFQAFQNHRTMQELGATDLETLKAKMREELLAEMQANPPVAAPKIPPSLSTTRSVSSRNGPAWSGPPALGDLLK